jgi:hypothetical protein
MERFARICKVFEMDLAANLPSETAGATFCNDLQRIEMHGAAVPATTWSRSP